MVFFQNFESVLSQVIDNRKKMESSAVLLAGKSELPFSLESGVKKKVSRIKIDGRVCAVDSGFTTSSSHEIDIFIARTIGVIFEYSNSTLARYQYIPSKFPEPRVEARISMDEGSTRVYGSLFRIENELSMAIECVKQFEPQILLMDGSLAMHPSDRPSADNKELYTLYENVLEKCTLLYDLCEKSNCLLIGLSKDSRSKRFSGLVGEDWPDTLFLDYLLNSNERTVAVNYYTPENPAPKKLGTWAEKLKLFYLKSVENDYPIRVEFLTNDCEAVASVVLSLSAINHSYAYPSILIEADLRAMLGQKEVEQISRTFLDWTKPLRAKTRPFR